MIDRERLSATPMAERRATGTRTDDYRTMPHELSERHRATRSKLGLRAAGIPSRMPKVVMP